MMQNYNTIPTFSVGGLLEKIAKVAGRAKIQGHANLLSKEQPELSKLLGKLAKSQKGGPKLSEEEAKKLTTLAQDYRRGNVHYQNKRKKIAEQLASKHEAAPAASATPAERAALNAEAEQAIAQAAPVTEQAVVEAAPVVEAAAAQAAAPGAVQAATTAAQGRLARAYGAMKNHPWLTAAAVAGLTNGSVRSGLGTAFNYWTTPASQWGSIGQAAPNSQMQIRLNDGSVVPVTMGQDGILTFGGQTATATTGVDPSDADIAQAIAEADGATTPEVTTTETPGTYTTNSDYNDIFENDAWDQ